MLHIQARVESQLPYDRLEIVCNGEVISSATPSGPRHSCGDSPGVSGSGQLLAGGACL